MKKLTALALVMVLALTLAACGGGNDTPSGGTDTPTSNTPSGNTDTPGVAQGGDAVPTPPESSQTSEPPGGGNGGDGVFLYAAVGFTADGTWGPDGYEVTEFHATDSFLLFFSGDTTGDWLPPAITDLALYIDGVPQQAALSETVIAGSGRGDSLTMSEVHGRDEFIAPYISGKRDDVTKYTLYLNERYDTPGEYRIEATVNGVKISSNTFIWHGGTEIEYLDDMPVPKSPINLTPFSWPAPAEIADFPRSTLWDIPLDMVSAAVFDGINKANRSHGEYLYSIFPDYLKIGVGPFPDAYPNDEAFRATLSAQAKDNSLKSGNVESMGYDFELGTYDGSVVMTINDALTLREHYINNGLVIVDESHDYNFDGTFNYYNADFSFEIENGSGTVSINYRHAYPNYLRVGCNVWFNW